MSMEHFNFLLSEFEPPPPESGNEVGNLNLKAEDEIKRFTVWLPLRAPSSPFPRPCPRLTPSILFCLLFLGKSQGGPTPYVLTPRSQIDESLGDVDRAVKFLTGHQMQQRVAME